MIRLLNNQKWRSYLMLIAIVLSQGLHSSYAGLILQVEISRDTTQIAREIDVTKTTRDFPALVAYRNTSLQKAPAPVLAEVSEKELGRPKVTRCWLNLDEMWDYRTRKFDFNFKIGVDKYKGVPEKHRETWDWEVESPVTYYQYLKSFSRHSDEIMLTIRRYERDIMDGKLPVSMDDWKMLFKAGLKHYKMLYPNIRYVEVGNESELKMFMWASMEEYYQFYKLGSEAVKEVNDELKLEGKQRLLVGGPVSTSNFIKLMDRFFELYSQDHSGGKQLDFISWHEYTQPVIQTAMRERQVRNLLAKYKLNENLPLFVSEHDPCHYSEDKLEYHHENAAGLVKTLYFSSLHSPNLMLIPWVLYHNGKLQTRFMWFEGPDKADTKYDEIRILPSGVSMKFLSQFKGKEIQVENSVAQNELVIAAVDQDKIVVEAVNYGVSKPVSLSLAQVKKVLGTDKVVVTKTLVDTKNNNYLTNKSQTLKINPAETLTVSLTDGKGLELKHPALEKNGIVFWEIKKQKP